jgi:hypothetical protein
MSFESGIDVAIGCHEQGSQSEDEALTRCCDYLG